MSKELKGQVLVIFNENVYSTGATPNPELLTEVVNFAAECEISSQYNATKRQILADYPNLSIRDDSPVENLLFLLFDEGFGIGPFEEAFKLFTSFSKALQREINENPLKRRYGLPVGVESLNLEDADLVELGRRFYEAGVAATNQFKTQYAHYFEEALTEQPFAPSYAFVLACERAGLDLDEWARLWPDVIYHSVGYSLLTADSTDQEATTNRAERTGSTQHAA